MKAKLTMLLLVLALGALTAAGCGDDEEAPRVGGGPGEEIFRSLMLDQYGRRIAADGGFGLADSVKRQLLSLQETGR